MSKYIITEHEKYKSPFLRLFVLLLALLLVAERGGGRRRRGGERRRMASNAAVPFWRAAGMTYITYSNLCANLVRNCLKEPHRTEALTREKVHFSVSKWVDGKPQKPTIRSDTPEE